MDIKLPFYLRLTILLFLIVLILALLYVGQNFLIPVSLAALLSVLLNPVKTRLQKWGLHEIPAIILSIIFLILVMSGIIYLVTSQLMAFARDIPELSGEVVKKFESIQLFIDKQTNVSPDKQISWVQDKMLEWLENSGSTIRGTISATTTTIAVIGLLPIYIFFFLLYKSKFKLFLFKLTSRDNHYKIVAVTEQIKDVVQNYLGGVFTVIAILAVLNTLGLTLLGIKYALFLGILAAILNIIPYIGILIGNIIAATIAFLTKDSIWYTVGVLIIFGVIQFIENNFLTPMITGSKVKINPLATIMALIIGGQLWGVVGMILFIPFLGVMKVIMDNVENLRPYGFLLGTETRDTDGEEKPESEWQKSLKRLFGGKDPKDYNKH